MWDAVPMVFASNIHRDSSSNGVQGFAGIEACPPMLD